MSDWLKGSDTPTIEFSYLARDGRYYNGYMGSTDFAEDVHDTYWIPARDRLIAALEAEIKEVDEKSKNNP